MRRNRDHANFRVFGPDETQSNRLGAIFEETPRTWVAETSPDDQDLGPEGRVMEILSEHTCQGWLEGYLLTGRHGLFSTYEAFVHVVDSMFNQHAKWLHVTNGLAWRRPIAYRRTNHGNLHVRGYKEEGTTTTPFDMAVLNDLDRFHLFADAMDRVEKLAPIAAYEKQWSREKRVEHRQWIIEHGEDMPEILDWRWPG